MENNNLTLTQTEDKGWGSFMVITNDIVGDVIQARGCWEPHLCHYYIQFIKNTDVVADVGANVGFHTVQFAKIASKVYAFEPQKLIFNILSTNILLNSATDFIDHYRIALGDKPGKLYMEPLENRRQKTGQENFGGRGLVVENNGEEEVEVITFDSLNLDIDVLKMDIQGSEPYALKGMENTIDRCVPWIMLENYPENKDDQKIAKWLQDKGYEHFRFIMELPGGGTRPHEDCIFYNPNKHTDIKETLDRVKNYFNNLNNE